MPHERTFNNFISKEKRRNLRKEATPQEVMLWSRLRGNRIFTVKFRRQYSFGPYILDFYCPEKQLVIEIDGNQHFQDDALVYDAARTQFLERNGCKVLRFTNTEINTNINGVVDMIWIKLGLHPSPQPSPYRSSTPFGSFFARAQKQLKRS